MKIRVAKMVLAAALVLAASLWIGIQSAKHKLQTYRAFIESAFGPELLRVEHEMKIKQRGPDDGYVEMKARLREAFAQPEIFYASWSFDGHHGLDALTPLPASFWRSPIVGAKAADSSRCLYFGEASDGTKLLVLVGQVPSEWMREYEIVFRRSEIERTMRSRFGTSDTKLPTKL